MTNNVKRLIKIVFILFTLMCMVLIFRFSMEDSSQSSQRSGRVTNVIVRIITPHYSELSSSEQKKAFSRAEHIIRKLAHFSVYNVLGFLASIAVGRRRLSDKKTLFVLGICFLYACSDELHQYFVPGRACQFRDVLIDTSGAVTGILISMIVFEVIGLILKNKTKKDLHKIPEKN